MAFPSLYRKPLEIDVKYREEPITGTSEDFYIYRRPRVTRNVRVFIVSYGPIPVTDCDLIDTHYKSVGTHTAFSWTDKEKNTYTVYYNKPFQFIRIVPTNPGWCTIEPLELIEQ